MKKIFFIFFLGILLFPFVILAGNNYWIKEIISGSNYVITYDGFVPCGRCLLIQPQAPASIDGECGQSVSIGTPTSYKFISCSLCHLFVMIDGIVDFILLKIVPPIATIILMISGIAFYQSLGNPGKFSRAKSIFISVIIGLLIIYASWVIINEVLVKIMGIADWVGFGEGWFRINCPIEIQNW